MDGERKVFQEGGQNEGKGPSACGPRGGAESWVQARKDAPQELPEDALGGKDADAASTDSSFREFP